jgi:hypothetical protein
MYDFKIVRDSTNRRPEVSRVAKVEQSKKVYFLKLVGVFEGEHGM